MTQAAIQADLDSQPTPKFGDGDLVYISNKEYYVEDHITDYRGVTEYRIRKPGDSYDWGKWVSEDKLHSLSLNDRIARIEEKLGLNDD